MTASRGRFGRIAIGLAAFASGLVVGCSGDPRCSVQNCQNAVQCHLLPAGTPDGICFQSASFIPYLRSDAGQAAIWQTCVDACNAANAGPALQCISQNFPGNTCPDLQQALLLDGGDLTSLGDLVLAKCGGGPSGTGPGSCGSQCEECLTQCNMTKLECYGTCLDAGSGDVCLSCTYNCSQQALHCADACPSN